MIAGWLWRLLQAVLCVPIDVVPFVFLFSQEMLTRTLKSQKSPAHVEAEMNKTLALTLILLLTASSIAAILPARAEAKTIMVPDDYPSIEAALNHAADGDTVFVKAGNYRCTKNQTLTIDKAVTVRGENPQNTVINLEPPLVPMWLFTYQYMGYLDAIKVQADNVKIEGLTITAPGGAISIGCDFVELSNNIINVALSISGEYVKVADNVLDTQSISITLSGSHHTILNNTLRGVGCKASYCTIAKNTFTGQAVDGLIVVEGNQSTVYANRINADGWLGIVVRLNANGTIIAHNVIEGCLAIHMDWASNSIVAANTIKNNAGINLDRGNNNIFYSNHLENNTIGLRMGYDQTDISRQHGGPSTVNNTVYHNNFIDNKVQAEDWNWLGTNHWDKDGEGNYWSTYTGTDWTLDGVGDSPYKLEEAKSYYAEPTQSVDHHPLMAPVSVNSNIDDLPDTLNLNLDTPPKQASYANLAILAAIPVAAAVAGVVYCFKRKARHATVQSAKHSTK